jgi:hypothetical protein
VLRLAAGKISVKSVLSLSKICSKRMRCVIGVRSALRATGMVASILPPPGDTFLSLCQPAQTRLYPFRKRRPSPASAAVLGSFAVVPLAPLLKSAKLSLLPRLRTSKNMRPLPRRRSAGFSR